MASWYHARRTSLAEERKDPHEQYNKWVSTQPESGINLGLDAAFEEGWRLACQTILSEIRSNTPIWSPEGSGETVMGAASVINTVDRVKKLCKGAGDKK